MTIDIVLIFGLIVTFLLGFFLGHKAGKGKRRADGYLDVVKGDSRLVYQLEINTPPEKLQEQDSLLLYIRRVEPKSPVEETEKFE